MVHRTRASLAGYKYIIFFVCASCPICHVRFCCFSALPCLAVAMAQLVTNVILPSAALVAGAALFKPALLPVALAAAAALAGFHYYQTRMTKSIAMHMNPG